MVEREIAIVATERAARVLRSHARLAIVRTPSTSVSLRPLAVIATEDDQLSTVRDRDIVYLCATDRPVHVLDSAFDDVVFPNATEDEITFRAERALASRATERPPMQTLEL